LRVRIFGLPVRGNPRADEQDLLAGLVQVGHPHGRLAEAVILLKAEALQERDGESYVGGVILERSRLSVPVFGPLTCWPVSLRDTRPPCPLPLEEVFHSEAPPKHDRLGVAAGHALHEGCSVRALGNGDARIFVPVALAVARQRTTHEPSVLGFAGASGALQHAV
jgi:hypothetical protein